MLWSWALVQGPAGTSSLLMAGLAAGLLAVVLAAALTASAMPQAVAATGVSASSARAGTLRMPRSIDPDAAGRPRPRAPGSPAVA